MSGTKTTTVWHAFYDLLRAYGVDAVFGNPGSTEQPMLKNFPPDIRYVLGLQEATVVSMADGYAQATRNPAVVSLHTAAGTGNGMGAIMTAFLNKTPLVIIAGQQTREMLLGDPFLTNRNATTMPQPWVKWAYEPVRAQDVPGALVRAFAVAMMPPAGPVYLSVPLDDWDAIIDVATLPSPRVVSTRVGPDPVQLSVFADKIRKSKHFGLVLGQEVDKSLAWDAAIALAEKLHVPVFQAPFSERAVFPETHELFKGALPSARGPLTSLLADRGLDTVLVVGAEVWRYYPYVAGPVKPADTQILQITSDPHDAGSALTGDSLLSDSKLALEALYQELFHSKAPAPSRISDPSRHTSNVKEVLNRSASNTAPHDAPMTALQAFTTVASIRPSDAILVNESPSNGADAVHAWEIDTPESYFSFASGGLGWAGPASVGIALAQKNRSSGRTTVLAVGDGSLQYSVQFLYAAVQEKVKLIILVPLNEEYAILKEFAVLEETPNVPALDLPGLDCAATAKAFGCPAFRANGPDELKRLFQQALDKDGPTLIEFPIDRTLRPLVASHASNT